MVVALVMLLLITIVGISTVKPSFWKSVLDRQQHQRNAVFQISEWGLSVAEQIAEEQATLCNSGFVNRGAPVSVTPEPGQNGKAGGNGATNTCTPTVCQNGLCGY